jgi:hypothetical protein
VSGDYLWDGSGAPDPEIAHLEQLLRPLGLPPDPGRALAPVLEASRPAGGPPPFRGLAAAAAVALAVVAALVRSPAPGDGERGASGGWPVEWLGSGGGAQGRSSGERRLRVGEWLFTGAGRARVAVGAIGEVELEPVTRVGLVDAGRRFHRLSLERGVLHATIWAPPGQFLVDTPSAVAVDLGCRYTLGVDLDGSARLRVEAGWVGLEHHGRESFVPAGAVCLTRPGRGPGTPYYEDAPPPLAGALLELDFGDGRGRPAALGRALASARPRDAVSLWHLLSRVRGAERGRVFDRLAALVPPPDSVTRAGILAGDRAMRDRWWDELGLGTAAFWREWTWRSSPAPDRKGRRARTDG